jgi:peptide subunit release factor 1 (eRF1)
MLDRLLGRESLKERIDELEEELHHTERELAAERERRKEAVTDRQRADERVNRLEDRITELEDRVTDRDGAEQGTDRSFRREEPLRGARLDAVLARLESVESDPEGLLNAYVDGDVPDPVAETLGDRTPLVRRAEPCLVYADDAGLLAVALDPPVDPEPFTDWTDTFRVDRSWFQPTGRHAVGLVRADVFALGVYEDGERVSFEGFTSDVMGDHSKGGFSQARFERIRDGQIDDHLEQCRDALAAVDAPLYLTGERVVLTEFEDLARVTRPVDATGKPEAALDDAVHEFWTTRLAGL